MTHNRILHLLALIALTIAPLSGMPPRAIAANDIVLEGPPGSSQFGQHVQALANGNFVVTDPGYSAGAQASVGAVYLYDGGSGALISTLTGSVGGSEVGSAGVVALPSGNFIVLSPNWDSNSMQNVGAVTWVNGDVGLNGAVDATNSLLGSHASDQVGEVAHVLSNGNVVVRSPHWANGGATMAGAVTWLDGDVGRVGAVGASNSLVGTHAYDSLGYRGYQFVLLENGNYLVVAPDWDNGSLANAGAVAFGNGATGLSGEMSAANSLVGTAATTEFTISQSVYLLSDGDYVVVCSYCDIDGVSYAGAAAWASGSTGLVGTFSTTNSLYGITSGDLTGAKVFPLTNGNYVLASPRWHNGGTSDAGAVTWASGVTGRVGPVTAANSLIGSTYNDRVGDNDLNDNDTGVWALANGNYVVASGLWDNGPVPDAGAVTWGNGASGTTGVVGPNNSLVGSHMADQVGQSGVTLLANGNYVVNARLWDNGSIFDAGAATWGNGTAGVTGTISAANSLVGSSNYDYVGSATALTNGHFVVTSNTWDNGSAANAGAITWGNGAIGVTGTISAANSLVGTQTNDYVGGSGRALPGGHLVVPHASWHDALGAAVGAVTWIDGTTGLVGTINASNSLIGQHAGDLSGGIWVLPDGNYVMMSASWDNGAIPNVGAVTWVDGTTGLVGYIGASNSLIGSTANDQVGRGDDWGIAVIVFPDGNYVVKSPGWDNGAVADAGAVTWIDAAHPLTGTVSAANSLVGSSASDQIGHVYEDLAYVAPGAYVLSAPDWDYGGVSNAGAVAFGFTATGIRGELAGVQSVHGTAPDNGGSLRTAFDSIHQQLVVGLPAENRVIVRRMNQAPTASAGPDQTVPTSAAVTLDGSASADVDGDTPLTFAWSQTGGPAVSLGDATSAQPTFVAPASPTTLTFSLTVKDAWDQTSTTADTVVIHVVTPVSPTSVTVSGPSIGAVDHGHTFRADVSPLSTTAPVTYTWEVTGRSPITHVGGISDTLTLTETVAGTRTVQVTASNHYGALVSASQTIEVVAGEQAEIDPSSGGTLTFGGNGQGSTQVHVPAGAVTDTTTLLLQPLPPASSWVGYSFAGAGFSLTASQDGGSFGHLAFASPVTITLTYTAEQLGGQSEGTLRLALRTGTTWVDAATTCTPESTYLREPAIHRVSVAICHLSDYAWFGQQQVFLPLLRR